MDAGPDSSDVRCPSGGEVVGAVVEELPSLLFRVRLANGRTVVATATGRHAMEFLRLLPGDLVRLRLAERDRTRARILGRVKS